MTWKSKAVSRQMNVTTVKQQGPTDSRCRQVDTTAGCKLRYLVHMLCGKHYAINRLLLQGHIDDRMAQDVRSNYRCSEISEAGAE